MLRNGRAFNPKAFEYIKDNADEIKRVARKLEVPATAIAGVLAKENSNYVEHEVLEKLLDYQTLKSAWRFDRSHQKWAADYKTCVDEGIADTRQEPVEYGINKVRFPVLVDVGPANFKIATAIRLLEKYHITYPRGDPLGLKGEYLGNYENLAQHLGRTDSKKQDTVIKFAGLLIKEAQDFYTDPRKGANQQDPNAYSPEIWDAYLQTYYTMGKTRMQQDYADYSKGIKTAGRDPRWPWYQAGDTGGLNLIRNAYKIGQALGMSNYGTPVPEDAPAAKSNPNPWVPSGDSGNSFTLPGSILGGMP